MIVPAKLLKIFLNLKIKAQKFSYFRENYYV